MPDDAGSLFQIVRRMTDDHELGLLTDGRLLERFTRHGDERAFAELVRRHASTVWRVCRCALRDPHAAEDACQATFLILFRKARGIGRPERIGNWLYGVARKIAGRARKQAGRRAEAEVPYAEEIPDREASAERGDQLDLHEELQGLPTKYHLPLTLCYLDGLTNDEAARRLGWPVGTLKVRLMRAREALRSRLLRRGVCLASGSLPILSATLTPPQALADATTAAVLAIGSSYATSAAGAAVLAKGVLQTMWHTKLSAVAACVVAGVAVAGMGGWAVLRAGEPVEPPTAAQAEPKPADPPKAVKEPPGQPTPPRDYLPPGGEAPITAQRFARTYVSAINNSHHWYFKGNRFVLMADAGGIPADLLKALLGPDRKADRVTGEWALNEARTHIVFSAIVADEKPGVKEAKLEVTPAGLMRVNLKSGGQYNTMHFETILPQPKGVWFPGYEHATKIDLAMLQGTWVVESRTAMGKKVPADDIKREAFAVTGETITALTKDGVERATFKLDAVPVPATLDLTISEGNGKGDKRLAVYELDGHRLKLHTGVAGGTRPEGFESKVGKDSVVTLFKRVADGSAAADRVKLQGEWKAVSCKSDGKDVPKAEACQSVTFDRDKTTWNDEASEYKLTDANGGNHMDVTMLNDPASLKTSPAIYKFDGERLVVHLANGGVTRPEGFESKSGSNSVVVVFERMKK